MKGNLGQIGLNSIQGWAFSSNKDQIAELKIYLDDIMIEEIKADLIRNDVLKAFPNQNKRCGFHYKFLPKHELIKANELRVVFSEDGKDLTGSPVKISDLLLKRDQPIRLDAFFIHIPKTAGTSFRLELLNYFGSDALYPNTNDLKKNNEQYPLPSQLNNKIPLERRKKIKIISGHYNLGNKETFSKNSKTITFLREPLARSISNLKHLQRHSTFFKGKSLMEIATNGQNHNSEIFNRQCLMLWHNKNPKEKPDISSVKQNLLNLDFVGITEHYKASIELCNQTLNWDLKGDIFANKAIEKDELIDDELLDFLYRKNRMDIKLYRFALATFKRKCKKRGIEI